MDLSKETAQELISKVAKDTVVNSITPLNSGYHSQGYKVITKDGKEYFIKKFGKYEYPVVKITTKCKDFAEEIKDILIQMEFRAKINKKWGRNYYGYDIVLHGKKQCEKWNKEILK